MRYYSTKQTDGGVAFRCIFCKHTVTTLDFDSAKGNRRTQAAAAMNQHAADVHLPRPILVPVRVGSRGAY